MPSSGDRKIRDALVLRGLLDAGAADAALAAVVPEGPSFRDLLTGRYGVDEGRLLEAVSEASGAPLENLEGVAPPSQALKVIPANLAGRYRVLPLRLEEGELVLAVSDPFDFFVQEDVRMRTGLELRLVLASERNLDAAIARAYAPPPPAAETVDDLLNSLEPEEPGAAAVTASVAFLDALLAEAVESGVEAIHIEPGSGDPDARIRLRDADRTLRRVEPPKGVRLATLLARLKVLAEMNIAERRIPQDGRLTVNARGRPVVMRCATFPTIGGESATLFLVRERAAPTTLAESGAPETLVSALRRALSSGGLTLAASTDTRRADEFLGVLAREVDAVGRVTIAITVEALALPEGSLMMVANADAGLTFAAGLHAALRQDPDVIVLGEIRDSQTLKLALDCAEAGVAVLAKVHVDGAAQALQRLLDMGVDAPRLSELLRLAVCRHTARREGREVMRFETLENGPALKRAIATRVDAPAMAKAMAECGLKTFREQGA